MQESRQKQLSEEYVSHVELTVAELHDSEVRRIKVCLYLYLIACFCSGQPTCPGPAKKFTALSRCQIC